MTRALRVAVAAAIALGLAASCGGGRDGSAVPPPAASVGSVLDRPIPAAIADLPLTKPDGSTTTLSAYRGKAVMITDYLTTCTDICPMITANAVAVARALAADGQRDVAALEITVDPARDTPARMRAYAKLYGAPVPGWTQLRASPAGTARLFKFFGLAYHRVKEDSPPDLDWWTHKPLTYDVAHQDAVIFLDAQGHERFVISGNPDATGTNTPARLVGALSPEGVHNLRHPGPFDWTVSQGLEVFSWLLNHRIASPASPPS